MDRFFSFSTELALYLMPLFPSASPGTLIQGLHIDKDNTLVYTEPYGDNGISMG